MTGCGENARFKESGTLLVEQKIYFTPDHLYEASGYEPRERSADTIMLGRSGKFRSQYSIDGANISSTDFDLYLQSARWIVGTDTLYTAGMERLFDKAGMYPVMLYTVDYLGDTLSDTILIYVDTPLSLQLNEPAQADLAVQPTEDGNIRFRWHLGGVEEWEAPQCLLGIGTHPDSVWNQAIFETPCFSPVFIQDPWLEKHYYWAVYAWTGNRYGQETLSPVQSFSVRRENDTLAHLRIPVAILDHGPQSQLRIRITDAQQIVLIDTLTHLESEWTDILSLAPASRITLHISSPGYPDYAPSGQVLSLPAGAFITTETMHLQDTAAPVLRPVQWKTPLEEPVCFLAVDHGSGIDTSSFQTEKDQNAIPSIQIENHSTHSSTICFPAECTEECRLNIRADDLAGNTGGDQMFWYLSKTDSLRISGPYPAGYTGVLP